MKSKFETFLDSGERVIRATVLILFCIALVYIIIPALIMIWSKP